MASLRAPVATPCRTLRRIPGPLPQSRRCGLRLSACPAQEKRFGADASPNPEFLQSPAMTASRKNLRGGLLRAAIRESMAWPRGWAGPIRPPTRRGNHNTLQKKLQRWTKFLVTLSGIGSSRWFWIRPAASSIPGITCCTGCEN